MPHRLRPVKATAKTLYGPRKILVCGYAPLEQEALLAMMRLWKFADVPAVFACAAEAENPVGELLALPGGHGQGLASDLPRAVVLAGLQEKELHTFMAAWKHLELPAQHWACLTPTSETWPLGQLLAELERERQALSQRAN